MMRTVGQPRIPFALSCAAAVALVAFALGVGNATGAPTADTTLVVDSAFVITNLDPASNTTPVPDLVYHSVYDTLLTFKGSNVQKLYPDLAVSYSAQKGGKRFVFQLRRGVQFSDGSLLTSKDVLFSFNRVKYLSLAYSPYLKDVTISAPNAYTVVLSSPVPASDLPALVASSSMAILNSNVVRSNGGLDTADAPKSDSATAYLTQHSAGSGPYVLESASITSQIILVRNPRYWGPKPSYSRVVLQNVQGSQQRLDIASGAAQVATDLAGPLLNGLPSSVQVRASTPVRLWLIELNADPSLSPVTANPKIREAIRYGMDYAGLRKIAGFPSTPAPGLVPLNFPGALRAGSALKMNLSRARQAVAASGIKDPSITLTYIGGLVFQGKSFDTYAQKIKSDLAAIGIGVQLEPLPYAAYQQRLYAGKFQMDFRPQVSLLMDPGGYLAFAPGGQQALFSHYGVGAAPASVVAAAKRVDLAKDTPTRVKAMQAFQRVLDTNNPPYVYLFDTASTVVASKTIKGLAVSAADWVFDIAALRTA